MYSFDRDIFHRYHTRTVSDSEVSPIEGVVISLATSAAQTLRHLDGATRVADHSEPSR